MNGTLVKMCGRHYNAPGRLSFQLPAAPIVATHMNAPGPSQAGAYRRRIHTPAPAGAPSHAHPRESCDIPHKNPRSAENLSTRARIRVHTRARIMRAYARARGIIVHAHYRALCPSHAPPQKASWSRAQDWWRGRGPPTLGPRSTLLSVVGA